MFLKNIRHIKCNFRTRHKPWRSQTDLSTYEINLDPQRFLSVAFHKTKGSSGQCGVLEIITGVLWWDCHTQGDDIISSILIRSCRLLKCNQRCLYTNFDSLIDYVGWSGKQKPCCPVSFFLFIFRRNYKLIAINHDKMLLRGGKKKSCDQSPVTLILCCQFIFHP